MNAIVDFINSILWGYVLVWGLLAVGIYLTISNGFLQFRHFPEFFRVVGSSKATSDSGITPFQALTISLAARVGTGNLAGVAVALYAGGPGAIFWMWMVALVGMCTAYAESALAQLYKIRNSDGKYRGGPAFYMHKGVGSKAMGMAFAVALLICFGVVFVAVQSNAIADAMEASFSIPKIATGLVVAAVSAVVVLGGIRSIAQIAEKVVPFMAGAYLLVALLVIFMNITEVPAMLALIVKSAFGLEQAVGGFVGGMTAAMLNGIQRGLFSNEAGMGSAPNIAAVAVPEPHHPSSQGLVQGLGVFIDTLLICTATALMILLSGIIDFGPDGVQGMELTVIAMEAHIGVIGPIFISAAILFFAFTSILGNYAYAENALEFLGLAGKTPLFIYKIVLVAMVVWGAVQPVPAIFNLADASMAIMATINLVALILLSKTVSKLTKDYFAQRKEGREPLFRIREYPELGEGVDHTIWNRNVEEERKG